jgi:hypothetical protein
MTETAEPKPIQLRPTVELRKRLESESKRQNRSLNNLLVVILTNYFRSKDNESRSDAR